MKPSQKGRKQRKAPLPPKVLTDAEIQNLQEESKAAQKELDRRRLELEAAEAGKREWAALQEKKRLEAEAAEAKRILKEEAERKAEERRKKIERIGRALAKQEARAARLAPPPPPPPASPKTLQDVLTHSSIRYYSRVAKDFLSTLDPEEIYSKLGSLDFRTWVEREARAKN